MHKAKAPKKGRRNDTITTTPHNTMEAAAPNSKVSLKILIDKKGQKVLFAEAGKDFVDFLFNLMALPIGTIIRLLKKDNMVGSLGNLYGNIQNLSDTYMQPNQKKDCLLKPKAPISFRLSLLSFRETQSQSQSRPWPVHKLSTCGNCRRYVTYDPNANCPSCGWLMISETSLVGPKSRNIAAAAGIGGEGGGYVKGVVTYMVMDDLVVTPMSTISSITMLNKFNVKKVAALEERIVNLSMNEGFKLLKASLQSKMVLTSVFLNNSGA